MQIKSLIKYKVNQCEDSDLVHAKWFQKAILDHDIYGTPWLAEGPEDAHVLTGLQDTKL